MNFFTKTPALGGKIKVRYWDFIVQEIYDNKIAQIIDFETKQEFNIPESEKDYLHFEMQKINTDLQDVVKTLALILRIGKTRISYAGLKDKRAVTSQRMCIYKPNVELLKKFNWKMVKLHSFNWSDKKVEIGDLDGNLFTITIRDINKTKDEIINILNEFKKYAFIPNRFGNQRFGGIREITHEVGKLFVLGKPKEAVLHYLTKISDLEPEDVKKAREKIIDGNYKEALKLFPKKGYRYEKAILHHLIKHPNDFVNAWLQLPKKITYLFTHAYQSFLFNKYLDLRLKELKTLDPVEGDIIKDNVVYGPLFGYEFKFASGAPGELEKKVLEQENISLEDFKIKNFPQMSVAGERRAVKLPIYDFKVIDIFEDEFFDGKNAVKISFKLPKASYATVVLEELIKEKIL